MFFRRHQVNIINITIPVISIRDISDLIIILVTRAGQTLRNKLTQGVIAITYFILNVALSSSTFS